MRERNSGSVLRPASAGEVEYARIRRKLQLQEHIAKMLRRICRKRMGRVEENFIIYTAPDLAVLPDEAIRAVLKDALADDESKDVTLATFWQPVREYCRTNGLPDPDHRDRLPEPFNLEQWQPQDTAFIN